ncbi:hypothetical protein [Sorangium sp. So ce1182]|uniref:hypothetical protein n=1 Tax=Sorangium sp. So ce1182 TaxID=3133334 RepID=UPI003F60B20D
MRDRANRAAIAYFALVHAAALSGLLLPIRCTGCPSRRRREAAAVRFLDRAVTFGPPPRLCS